MKVNILVLFKRFCMWVLQSWVFRRGHTILVTFNSFFFKHFIVFHPIFLKFFNWKSKCLFLLGYVFFFFLFLYLKYGLIFYLLPIKDFFFLLKLKGYLYFFLLFLSFLSALPWFPRFSNFSLLNFFKFFFVFFLYHTIFVAFFFVLPFSFF